MIILIVILLYYLSGRFFISFLCKNSISHSLYLRAYVISVISILIMHYGGIYLFNFHFYNGIPGIIHGDELEYHSQAITQVRIGNLFSTNLSADWAYLWQVIVATNYYLFGINILLPKIANALLFSLSVVIIYNLVLRMTNDKTVALRSYWLYLTFLPLLLYYNNTILKETLVSFLLVILIYIYQNLSDKTIYKKGKWIFLYNLFLILLFLTRHQFALIILVLSVLIFLTYSRIRPIQKIVYTFFLIGGIILFLNTPVVTKLQFMDRFSSGHMKSLAITANHRVLISGSYTDYALYIVNNPLTLGNQIIYGTFVYIMHPLPYNAFKMDFNKRPIYAINAAHNLLFYILIPSIIFGFLFRKKNVKLSETDLLILSFWIVSILAIIINGRDPTRYRVAFFPLLLVYAPIGLSYYREWKKYNTITALVYILFVLLFLVVFDLNKMIGFS